MKTNAARILDGLGIASALREYEVGAEHLDAEHVAAKIGIPVETVFKTLVARGDRNGVCLAVIPAHRELDLKALARITGDRKVDTIPLKEVQPLTGYVRGGVTAIGTRKAYPVFVDESAAGFERISISAGHRGVQLTLAPVDYLSATQGQLGPISRPKSG